jgi:DNA-binding protein Fis
MTLSDHKEKQIIRDTVQKRFMQYFRTMFIHRVLKGYNCVDQNLEPLSVAIATLCNLRQFHALLCNVTPNIKALLRQTMLKNKKNPHTDLPPLLTRQSQERFTVGLKDSMSRAGTRVFFCKCSFIQQVVYLQRCTPLRVATV